MAESLKGKRIQAVHDAAIQVATEALTNALRIADERELDPGTVVQATSQMLAATSWAAMQDDADDPSESTD
jgi:hypothetical protein